MSVVTHLVTFGHVHIHARSKVFLAILKNFSINIYKKILDPLVSDSNKDATLYLFGSLH